MHVKTISRNLTHLLRTPPPFGTRACSFIEGSTSGGRTRNETPSSDIHWEQAHASHRQQADAHVRVRPAKSVRYQRGRCHPRTVTGGNRRVLTRVKDPERFGVVELRNGKLVKLVEKPKQYISDLALAGVYFFRSTIFSAIEKLKPSWRNELEITDAIQALLDAGGKITYHEVSGWWKDTGRPEDILEANQLVLRDLKPSMRGKIEEGVAISGNVDIGNGSVVRKGTALRGPVIIGDNSEIGGGAKVGPNTSVGSRVRIMHAEIEDSIILDGALVDCKERIVDSIIGKDSRIVSTDTSSPRRMSFVVGESTFVKL